MVKATREMIIFGMCYKRGHMRKNWSMRLLVLDGGKCSYYELGAAEKKNSFELSQVRCPPHFLET